MNETFRPQYPPPNLIDFRGGTTDPGDDGIVCFFAEPPSTIFSLGRTQRGLVNRLLCQYTLLLVAQGDSPNFAVSYAYVQANTIVRRFALKLLTLDLRI